MTIVYIIGILAVCATLIFIFALTINTVIERRLENRFQKIQNVFASNNPDARAVAALQLGEMALIYSPRIENGKPRIDYPYLHPIASQIAVALNVERNDKVRTALIEARKTLTRSAKDKAGFFEIQGLADIFANANQTALNNYIKSLASYLVLQSEAENSAMREKCALVSPFCQENSVLNREIVQTLCTTERFQAEMEVQREGCGFLSADKGKTLNEITTLSDVQDAASRLINTRDAFADCLKLCGSILITHIEQQFLAGADLSCARLHSSHFDKGFLIGANLYATDLTEASFRDTFMTYANLSFSFMQRASFVGANLQNANFEGANLAFAQFDSAKVASSNLNEVRMISASWKKANFYRGNDKDNALYDKLTDKFDDIPEDYNEEYQYWEAKREQWD